MNDLQNKVIKNPMRINNEFDIGEIVYLKTDEDQKERMVTALTVRPGIDNILYELSCGEDATDHYGTEISSQRKL